MRPSPPPPPCAIWAYFLDFDGTLADLAPTPDAVRISARALDVVRRLSVRSGGAVAFVSGRSIADLDRLLGDPRLPAAGQHGLERRDRTGLHTPDGTARRALRASRRRLTALAERHPGLLLEDKGTSLAVHYRQAPEHRAVVHEAVERERVRLGDGFRLQHGKCVVELRPVGGGKASAIAAFRCRLPFRDRVPVFIGDDETDEEGFAHVNAAGGISVHVGEGETQARWSLPDPAAVIEWLGQVASPMPSTEHVGVT